MLFALNSQSHAEANSWFAKKRVFKTYEALSLLNSEFSVGLQYEWKCRLLRGKKRAYEHELGKSSLTRAKPIRAVSHQDHKCFLWELYPWTGRAHQLRYEMFRHQIPIVGDALYGSQVQFKPQNIALRAVKIVFPKDAQSLGLSGEYSVSPLINS